MKQVLSLTAVIALLFITIATIMVSTGQYSYGSVIVGNDYHATTSIASSAGTHWQARVAANGGCALGSIVIASTTSSANITLWNATSTTDTASTTIVTIPPNAAAGTYTFDIVCARGLVVETPTGFTGQTVVTFR